MEGNDLPGTSVLEPIVQAALEIALTSTGSDESVPPLVRLSGARTNGSTTRFCFEVSPVLPKLLADKQAIVDARDALASRLQSEASCRGSARLLPALVEQLDVQAVCCGRCRLRLELDEAVGSPTEGWVESAGPAPSAVQGLALPAWASAGKDGSKAAASSGPTAAAAPAKEDFPQRPSSPTAANLARNPELRARVMAGAIPFDSEMGRRLSSGKCHSRALTASPPKCVGDKGVSL